jgi:hypothetical protein
MQSSAYTGSEELPRHQAGRTDRKQRDIYATRQLVLRLTLKPNFKLANRSLVKYNRVSVFSPCLEEQGLGVGLPVVFMFRARARPFTFERT